MGRLRRRGFLTPERQEILRALDRRRNFPQKLLQIFVSFDEVDIRCIDDQQVGRCVVKEEVLVSLGHLFKIIFADRLLAG